ncbi:MAG: autotransporter domain-containing protein [Rhodoferax sp.]|nr:autotransporter domain-containing protein [Rhodoferax sp.]
MVKRNLFLLKRSAVFVGLMMGALASANAHQFSNIFVFGDSLSDAGVYAPLVGANSRFTTNPGTVWAENLGTRYGLSVNSAYAATPGGFLLNATGNDFAVGGARVNATPGVLGGLLAPLGAVLPPVSTQVSGFLARGPVDSNALYSVWAGANDVFTQMAVVGAGGSIPGAQSATVTAAKDLVAQITRLQSAGARNLVVINVPDIGATPFGVSGGTAQSALATGLTTAYNATLASGLVDKNLLYFDGVKLFSAILADPAAYGFTNTRIPACGAASSLGCAPGAAAVGALFADGVHPSSTAHQVISDWVYSTLEASGRIGLLSTVPLGRSGAQSRAMDSRMQEFQNFGYKGQGFFVTGDYSSTRSDGNSSYSSTEGNGSNLLLGYEKAFNDSLFGGLTLSYGRTPLDLGNAAGTVKYDEWAFSAFASHKVGNFYANAQANYSWLGYESTRNIALGPFNTSERGDTNGRQLGVKGQVGYNLSSGHVVHGPLAALAWERGAVDGFSEKSGSVTAMSFGEQIRESLRSRLGWQIAADDTWADVHVRPYAQLTYDYEHNSSYSAGWTTGSASTMAVQNANRSGGYGTLLAGINADISKTTRLGVGASTSIGQPGVRNSSISVTLSAPF